jgi:hypothetical protein
MLKAKGRFTPLIKVIRCQKQFLNGGLRFFLSETVVGNDKSETIRYQIPFVIASDELLCQTKLHLHKVIKYVSGR